MSNKSEGFSEIPPQEISETKDNLVIPVIEKDGIRNVKGKKFFGDYEKEHGLYGGLEQMEKEGYTALYMPQLVDALINSPNDSELWRSPFNTPSLKVIGTPKEGKYKGECVQVYMHMPHRASSPSSLKLAVSKGYAGDIKFTESEIDELKKFDLNEDEINYAISYSYCNYGIRLTDSELEELIAMDGKIDKNGNRLVWVIKDEDVKKRYEELELEETSRGVAIATVENLPEVIAFFGGEERAKKFLTKYKEVTGYDTIMLAGVGFVEGYGHITRVKDPDARLLLLNSGYSDLPEQKSPGWITVSDANHKAKFLGIKKE